VVEGLKTEWGKCYHTVLLEDIPWTLSYRNNTIAIGSALGDILILDVLTGRQTAILYGHTNCATSVTFSSDGASLVSGSKDKTVKLWDMQTGGVVKTFYGYTSMVCSVSISADSTTIASGSDRTIHLWNIQTGECHKTIEQQYLVYCVRFSPKNPQTLMSVYPTAIQQWEIDSCYTVGPTYDGNQIAFSSDGTQFAFRTGGDITVQNINSGVAVAKFNAAHRDFGPCCFSPDGRLVAIGDDQKFHLWDITGSHPHLVETFVGHVCYISNLTFSSPSNIISASCDRSVKFWQIGAPSMGLVVTDPKSTPLTSTPARSITLKAKNSPIIPSDLPDGVIKTWGTSAGCSKRSPQIPAQGSHENNIQQIDSKLIFVWYADEKINIWDAEKGELLQTMKVPRERVTDLMVSGDGSKVFCLYEESIQAWDIWTSEAVGEVQHQGEEIIAIDGSKIWAMDGWRSQGWDFGIPGSSPVKLSIEPPDRLHLNDTKLWEINMSRMQDVVTGKVVFQLPERFGKAVYVQIGGQYLVAYFRSKEVLILDFSHTLA